MGDPNGIGIEVILKAIRVNGGGYTCIGTQTAFEFYQDIYEMKDVLKDSRFIEAGKMNRPRPGIKDESATKLAIAALEEGIESIRSGTLRALVTAPLSKELVSKFIPGFTGHTEYLAKKFKVNDVGMLGIRDDYRILFHTTHLPLKNVFEKIKPREIENRIIMLDGVLKNWFAVERPHILVSGVNPHSYEFSTGEEELILQGVEFAQQKGINVAGPVPGDTLFTKKADGYLAIYHDQGMIFLKSKPGGTNITVGLPFLRASPLHGTGFDIAGKNLADPTSMIETLSLVEEIIDRV